jgi:hypothetical protein
MKSLRLVVDAAIPLLILILLGSLAFLIQQERDPEEIMREYLNDVVTVSTPREFDEVMNSDRIILHIDVDWSIYAVLCRSVVGPFKTAVDADASLGDVVFGRIDCTEQDAVYHHTKQWLESNGGNRFVMSNGAGAILWIHKGRVADTAENYVDGTADDLLARTHAAFGYNLNRRSIAHATAAAHKAKHAHANQSPQRK